MGRSPKTEPAEDRQPPHAGHQPPPDQNAYAPPRAPQPPAPAPPERATAPPPAREATPGASRAVTESEALARDLKEGVVSGFVGTGTTVAGDAEFKGMLRIDGHFSGRVRSEKGTLIVSAGGLVEADVEVATARVNGTLEGDIVASERIEFGRAARVRGNIQTPTLVIEEGAIFEGQCRMTPKAAPAARPVAAPQTKPAPPRPVQTTPAPAPARAAAPNTAEAAG
jgi:cytoskeletal protein CcmA (bactofilin family)